MALILWLRNAFLASWLINSFCAHVVFESSTDGGWHNVSVTSDGWGWFIGWFITSPLTINNYLLKHNGVKIMYSIYLYGNWVIFCCIWETENKVSGLYSLSMLLIFWLVQSFLGHSFFFGKALVPREIYFLNLLSSVWTSDIFSLLTLKTYLFFFMKDSPGNKHSDLAIQSQII